MPNCPDAILQIWITKKPTPQGKFFYVDTKPYFLFNMEYKKDKQGQIVFEDGRPVINKYWKKFNAYSISSQIWEVFGKAKVKPTIIAKLDEANQYWSTTYSDFKRHGFGMNYGGHRQILLSLDHWRVRQGRPEELFNLPVMDIADWLASPSLLTNVETEGITRDGWLEARLRMKKEWEAKYA